MWMNLFKMWYLQPAKVKLSHILWVKAMLLTRGGWLPLSGKSFSKVGLPWICSKIVSLKKGIGSGIVRDTIWIEMARHSYASTNKNTWSNGLITPSIRTNGKDWKWKISSMKNSSWNQLPMIFLVEWSIALPTQTLEKAAWLFRPDNEH